MFNDSKGYNGLSVDNLDVATKFYQDTLGLKIEKNPQGLTLLLPGGNVVFVYQKDNHIPATYTVIYLPVTDIDTSAKELSAKGITFEQYEGMTDEHGIARGKSIGRGPDIAWFTDPAGNILAILTD